MKKLALAVSLAALLVACSPQKPAEPAAKEAQPAAPALPPANPLKNVYFGDLHLHTRNSFDAYIFNVRATPDDAYKYAKGGTIGHPSGYDMKLDSGPLDFLAVTDHSEYLGVLPAINTPGDPYSKVPYAAELFSTDQAKVNAAFRKFADTLDQGKRMEEFADRRTERSAWQDAIQAAKRAYEPGKFTSLVAYEFTSAPGGRNLHRNVIFSGDKAPETPFTALESQNPEDLWRWLDTQRANGMEALSISHNANGSDGTMYERTMWNGKPVDKEWAELRARNEPLTEITQTKGTSETHPMLSPNDEFAGFEIMEWYIGQAKKVTKFDGGYVRKALKDGLQFQQTLGVNPYKYGFTGSSDSHNAAGSYEEDNYHSKVGIRDGLPELRGSVPPKGKTWKDYQIPDGIQRFSTWGASGLTGVWAEQNTREAIYGAIKRKETFATSGPRIRVRFFAGYDLKDTQLSTDEGVKKAYANGVAMGSDLVGKAGAKPDFLVMAMRDSHSAPLQRIQIVKGWVDASGKEFEEVYDVACADGGKIDAKKQRCSDNGAKVDVKTCKFDEDKGDAELSASWTDPKFDPKLNAFYYARVIEDPTCRWSTWDAIRANVEPNPALPKTIQERAYTSPIWYIPTKG
ncbi:MAG TPA: DUF3604 domain-containing protein [Hyphomonadaceae bacterium]|nr:DUF3604 domain-containing protein [Hyphomonadaceae bacterium]